MQTTEIIINDSDTPEEVGEEGDGLFEYYAESSRYDFGVLVTLDEAVSKRGWWFEWNDPGTIMCWPN